MKIKIKSFGIDDIPMEMFAFYIPKTNTIYYNKKLNNYPNLKKVCIMHEKMHSKLFKGKMTCWKILQNLEFELRDSVKWRISNPQHIIEKNKFFKEEMNKSKELHKIKQKKHFILIQFYQIIYQIWLLILIAILFPYELYIERKYKK